MNDVPGAGCALFGVVLCRKGRGGRENVTGKGSGREGRGRGLEGGLCGWMGWVFLWVCAVLGLAGARRRDREEGVAGGKERQEGRSEEEEEDEEEGARRVDSG